MLAQKAIVRPFLRGAGRYIVEAVESSVAKDGELAKKQQDCWGVRY